VDDKTLAGLYANATLFVLPSQDEGFGLPALEAMASGTPVIVSDGGALPEIVGEAGVVFKVGCYSERSDIGRRRTAERAVPQPDMNSLSEALKACLSSARLRSTLQEKGLVRAREFSWQMTAEFIWKKLNEI
jgi:glycosyltransferase involved in cell wall biosynthesis